MSEFWRIGNNIINRDHIVRVEYAAPYAGGEQDDEQADGVLTKPRPAIAIITLTEVSAEVVCDYSDHAVGAASESKWIKVRGVEAERLWDYMNSMAIFPASAGA